MASISREDVAQLARLSRLALSDEELDEFAGQLDAIVGHVAEITEVAAEDVTPMSHPVAIANVYREDTIVAGLTPEQALDQAPAADEQRFEVPQMLGEE